MGVLGFPNGALLRLLTTGDTQPPLPILKFKSVCLGPRSSRPHQAAVRPPYQARIPLPTASELKCLNSLVYASYSFSLFIRLYLPSPCCITDTTCVLLAPRQPIIFEGGLLTKLLACLATRYSATPAALRAAVSKNGQEWGKVRILNDGDTIRASALVNGAEDSRDASFVRVSHRRPSILIC